jgi:hypothetical protein
MKLTILNLYVNRNQKEAIIQTMHLPQTQNPRQKKNIFQSEAQGSAPLSEWIDFGLHSGGFRP